MEQQVPSRSKHNDESRRRALCTLVALHTLAVCALAEPGEIELLRLSALRALPSTGSAQPDQLGASGAVAYPLNAAALEQSTSESAQVESAASNTGPPVYRSAPKHIDRSSLANLVTSKELRQAQAPEPLVGSHSVRGAHQPSRAMYDLHTAAGHYKKKKKKKIIVVKTKKKKKRKKKKKKVHVVVVKKKKKQKHSKKKKKKIIVVKKKKPVHYVKKMSMKYPVKGAHAGHVMDAEKHEAPQHHEHYSHEAPGGMFYEYRAVPKPRAWKFGFKRGNEKHMIERHEHGHKSHFKTLFTWKDKKGKGKHLFDYNHDDKHKKHYKAAATSAEPQLLAIGKQPASVSAQQAAS